MTARLAGALAVLCLLLAACREARPIGRERFAREARSDVTGIVDERLGRFERPRPSHLCELGQRRTCFGRPGPHLPMRDGPGVTLYERCVVYPDGIQRWSNADCNTPLLVAFDAAPVKFTKAGAVFTVGNSYRTEWVSARTPWLALDRDGSGCIESEHELFAGFAELAELDANADGRIDSKDPAFAELLLWADADQDKRCTPNELVRLSTAFERLPLAFTPRAPPKLGSYEGDTALMPGGARLVDVHLAALD